MDFKADQVAFQFAVVSDNAGNMRRRPFIRAVKTLNLLQPDFVMSVGDFINGYRPTAEEINAMWDEFLPWLKPLEPPFFFVVGNHDFGSPVMKPIWNERFGREYYHFTYKGALFLCMNAIDNNHRRGIGEEQVAYFRKVLEENPKPLWTFVFLHAPLWQEPNAPGWKEIEALLADRPHTVFAGHIHQYLKEIRNNGNEYYTLSVTGGGNLLRGPAYGDFDHVAWVSVKTHDKPLVANVDINHVHPSNVRTPANKSIAWSVDRAVHFPPVRIADENVTTIQAEIVIQNWTDNAGRISGTIKPHPSLTITPRSFDVTLEPKSRQAFPIELKAARPMNPLDIRPIEFEGVARYEVADDSPSVWPIKASLELDVVGKVIEAAAPVEVDGRLTEWGELPHDLSRPRVIGGNAMAFTGDSDVSAKFALSHDAENLYIAVAVSDDAVIVGENGDGVELWLDTRPDKERLSGVGVRREMFNNVLRMTILPGDGDAPARLLEADNMPANTRFAAVRTQQGYSVEIAIPVKYLNEKAKRDSGWQDLRFNACVKDVDAIGEQSAQIWWRPDWQGRSNLPGSGTFAR